MSGFDDRVNAALASLNAAALRGYQASGATPTDRVMNAARNATGWALPGADTAPATARLLEQSLPAETAARLRNAPPVPGAARPVPGNSPTHMLATPSARVPVEDTGQSSWSSPYPNTQVKFPTGQAALVDPAKMAPIPDDGQINVPDAPGYRKGGTVNDTNLKLAALKRMQGKQSFDDGGTVQPLSPENDPGALPVALPTGAPAITQAQTPAALIPSTGSTAPNTGMGQGIGGDHPLNAFTPAPAVPKIDVVSNAYNPALRGLPTPAARQQQAQAALAPFIQALAQIKQQAG